MDKNKLRQGKEGCERTTDSSHTVTAHVASHRKLFSGKSKLVGFFLRGGRWSFHSCQHVLRPHLS